MAPVLVGTLLLAGCTENDSAPEPEPVAGPSLCEVIDADVLKRLSGDRTARPNLMLGNEVFLGCDADGMSSFEFGVKVVDDGRELSGHVTPDAQKVSGIGDEAFRSTTGYADEVMGETIVARRGDRIVYVRNELLQYGDERATEQDTVDVAKRLLSDDAADLIESIERVEVSGPCPSVDDVAKLVGPVQAARGLDAGDDLQCRYVGADATAFVVERFAAERPVEYLGTSGEAIEIAGSQEARAEIDGAVAEIRAITDDQVLTMRAHAGDPHSEAVIDDAAFEGLAREVAESLLG